MKKSVSKKNPANPSPHPQAKPKRLSILWVLGGVVVAAVALGMVWFALTPNRSSGGIPKLETSAERLELGRQTFNQPVRATFTVKNIGTAALMLNVPRSATVLKGC